MKRVVAQDGLQNGWQPEKNQGVCLPQLVAKVTQQQPPPILGTPPRRKKNKKADKWRRKAEANRRKQEEAKKARLAHGRRHW